MKTVALRRLVREPAKIKRLTRAGKSVQVTDNGKPLWIIHPAVSQDDAARRRHEIEAELTEVSTESDEALQHARKLSDKHTERLGCRGLDLLHVALPLALRCEVFLTADRVQGAVARAERLRVIISGGSAHQLIVRSDPLPLTE
jgi:antitoxin (DNA-binding transcriptional repressor) of toxin-antitoxin stability system